MMRIKVMMNLRKKTLALALTAAVVGGVASLAQAQTVAANSLGQALIYPYLTAKTPWNSFFHVMNTSSTLTVAAKVRFRTASDSADAYDFILVLSPGDMWTASIESNGSQFGFRPTDNSCTVPYFGNNQFTPFIVQASEVYGEVIMMGVSNGLSPTNNPIAVAAKHDTNRLSPNYGKPANCSAVELAFASTAGVQAATEFNNSLLNPLYNVLTGKFDLINVGKGWSGAARATVIANFGAPPAPLLAGSGPYFANTNMWSQAQGDYDHPTLAEGTTGLTALNTVLTKAALINEWVLNPNLGELSSWIVAFPTKKLTTDAMAAYNALAAQTPKLYFGDPTKASNCVPVTPAVYNREEAPLITGSPGAPSLCNEVNVINFKSGAIDSSSVLDSGVAYTVNTDQFATGGLAGWMQLGMPNNSVLAPFNPVWTSLPGWVATGAPIVAAAPNGRPVVGFNLTARATPADTVLYDHAFLP
jgi:hypothetical protein